MSGFEGVLELAAHFESVPQPGIIIVPRASTYLDPALTTAVFDTRRVLAHFEFVGLCSALTSVAVMR